MDNSIIRVSHWLFTKGKCGACPLTAVTVKVAPDLYVCRVCLDRNPTARAWVALQPASIRADLLDAFTIATDRLSVALFNRIIHLANKRGPQL